jgi:hypothetical protein
LVLVDRQGRSAAITEPDDRQTAVARDIKQR